jgi:hypothetical protein
LSPKLARARSPVSFFLFIRKGSLAALLAQIRFFLGLTPARFCNCR